MAAKNARKRGARRRVADAYHHGDLERALVDTALALVEESGAQDFSLRDAAERCGVVVSSAYRHFASKNDLLLAVADRGFAALADAMEAEVARATHGLCGREEAEVRLVALGRTYVLFATDRSNLFRLMYGPFGIRGGRGDPRPDAPAHRSSTLLLAALHDVQCAYGRADTDLETSKLVAWAAVHGLSMLIVDGVWEPADRSALEAQIAELGQTVLRSLR